MLSESFATEAARSGKNIILADLDVGQRTSFEWGEARERNGFEPRVKVVVIDPDKHGDFGIRHASSGGELLIIDAPGFSDEKTLGLAGFSDVVVLPTGASVADLRPTIRLMHELTAKGIAKDRIVTALCRVKTPSEIKFAREYLGEAGFDCLKGMLRDMPSFRNLQNQGRAATEADTKSMRLEALELVGAIDAALQRSLQRQGEKPERYERSPERYKGRER